MLGSVQSPTYHSLKKEDVSPAVEIHQIWNGCHKVTTTYVWIGVDSVPQRGIRLDPSATEAGTVDILHLR